ncbi:MAG TPA: aldo/keto reductase, partial [Deinococcales bacterium]|nr:aldo/keto reductase [Deinococcales bacterium]
GKTGLRVSVVGVGTWQFGGEWGDDFTPERVTAILDRAADEGINLIDTAECYGDHLSERLIGQAIRGRRDEWVLATKFGHKFHGRFQRTDCYTARDAVRQLEDSLKALGTDHVDLLQFHSGPDTAFDDDDLWEALTEQVRLGRVRHLGISVGKNDNLHQVGNSTRVGASAVQVVYNRLDRKAEEGVLPSCQQQDLGVLARVPLASGYLSGKYRPGDTFTDPNDTRSRHDPEEVQRKLREVEEIRASELPDGVDMATWALGWCLRHPAVTTVIPGCKSPEQVSKNAGAARLAPADHPQAAG